VIPGRSACKEVESETEKGRKPMRNALSNRSPLETLELSPAADLWETVWRTPQSCLAQGMRNIYPLPTFVLS